MDYRIIVIYNQSNMKALIGDLTHEIGHVVQDEIFYDNKKDDNGILIKQENNEAMLEYAGIYNKSEYYTRYDKKNHDEWAGSLSENFAEDFANIYAGRVKKSAWQGNHESEVKAFIEEKITKSDTPKFPQIKSAEVALEENVLDIVDACLRKSSKNNILYTKNPTVNINIGKIIANGNKNKIEAEVSSNDYYNINSMNDENKITLRLPKKGKYKILIVSNTSLGKKLYYQFEVIYGT